jgi:hypothetical protein
MVFGVCKKDKMVEKEHLSYLVTTHAPEVIRALFFYEKLKKIYASNNRTEGVRYNIT